MKAALYLRQSLDKAGDELGVKRQEAECRRLCEVRGYTVYDVITDNSVSATTGKRPGYDRLLELVQQGYIDVVVVLRMDRLLRRMTDLEALIELSERTGVQVATVQGDLDLTSSQGRLVGRLLASVARAEMETKSERHKLANQQKASAGKPHGSRRPYGYEADLVTVRESEAGVLREMASRVIAGHNYAEVAWWANSAGHRTSLGKLWYPVTVRNLLLKKRYAGIRSYNGAEYPATWAAVFDPETWERLQLTMQLRRDRCSLAPNARKYLLTGLLYCGICNTALNGTQKQDRPSRPKRRIYLCRVQGDTQRERGCGGVTRNADALDDWITQAVLYRLDTPELGQLLTDGPNDGELRAALEARQAQRLRLDVLVDDYATGLLSRDQLTKAKTSAEAELQRLDDEVQKLSRERGALVPVGQSVRQAWDSSQSDEWRRSLLSLLIKRIVVMPGSSKPFHTMSDGRLCRFDPSLIQVEWLA